jgi:hypothetical protein
VQRAFYLTLGLIFYDWTCVGPPIIYLNIDYAIRAYHHCISSPETHEQYGESRRAQGLLCGPWAPTQRGGRGHQKAIQETRLALQKLCHEIGVIANL